MLSYPPPSTYLSSFLFTLHAYGSSRNCHFPVAILCFVSLCRYFWTALSSVRYSHCWSIAFIKKKDVIGKTSLENER